MARLPPSIITKKKLGIETLSVSWDYTYIELALLYMGNDPFL
jgi:hypothetical protein